MRKMHEASSLESGEDLNKSARTGAGTSAPRQREMSPHCNLSTMQVPQDSIEQVISVADQPASSRATPDLAQLSTILDRSTRGIPADFLDPVGSHLNDLYLIVNSVVGLGAGTYFYRWEENLSNS